MNSEQRRRTVRKLLDLTNDPEAKKLAQNLFCSSELTFRDSSEDRIDKIIARVSMGFATAALAYPFFPVQYNFALGSVLILATFACLCLALWQFPTFKLMKWRVSSVAFFLVAFALSDTVLHWENIQNQNAAARKNTYQLFTGSMKHNLADPIGNSIFEYTNGGEEKITVTEYDITVEEAYTDLGLSIQNSEFDLAQHIPLESGSDGKSETLVQDVIGSAGNVSFRENGKELPVNCADLLIRVKYTLDSDPRDIQVKPFRLVTRRVRGGLEWTKQPFNASASFCTDREYQFGEDGE